MVQSVSYNNSTKNLSYEVVYKDTNDPSKKIIVEEVTESKLAYAANCPITITNNNDDGSEVEGTVLLPKPSSTDPNTIQYTVMITDGSLARYEEGIDAKRVQYRKVKPDDTKVASLKDDTSIVQQNEVLVPSSITCDSVANVISRGKRARETAASVDTLTVMSKNSKKKRNCGSKKDSSGSMTSYIPHHRTSTQIEMKSHYMQNHGAPQLVISVPSWLQQTRSEQQQLYSKLDHQAWLLYCCNYPHITFSYLYMNIDKLLSSRSHLEWTQETNCIVTIDFDPRNLSMMICAYAMSNIRDLDIAREKIQDLLVNYLDYIGDPDAKGRLVWEVASNCHGPHRPIESTSAAVRVRDLYSWRDHRGKDYGSGPFLSLVELPFELKQGEKKFHLNYILWGPVLKEMKRYRCWLKVCSDRCDVPVINCDPFVIVTGGCWRDVDECVRILKDVIMQHIHKCGKCRFS